MDLIRMIRNLVLLAAVLACVPAAAQDAVLHPGSAAVAGERIGARIDTFDYMVPEDGEFVRVGELTMQTSIACVEGREAVVRTETTSFDEEVAQVDSFALDRRTLAAIVVRSDGVEGSWWLRFGGAGVRMVEGDELGADTSDVELSGPVFYVGSTDLLLAALPLADGYAATLAVYDPDLGMDTIRVRVEAAERLLSGGAGATVWRVWVSGDASGGWYWMDQESRTLVQYQTGSGTVRLVRTVAGRGRARPTR
jgi:hypothetical protein